jgi:hypothetical protein
MFRSILNALLLCTIFCGLQCATSDQYDSSKKSAKDRVTSSLVLETIDFAGYTWIVKSGYCSVGNTAGPGPNYYCGDEEDLWVDGSGYLHMKMNYKSALSHYGCVSIKTLVSGCGTYNYLVGDGPNGSPDSLDPNVVVGLFTYDESVSDNGEIDIEISDWGDSTPDANLWFVTWLNSSSTYDDYLVTFGSGTTVHEFTWAPSYITFNSTHEGVLLGDGVRIGSAVYDCPTEPIYARINFWLVDGDDPASSQEVVIEDFTFAPFVMLNQPTGLSATTQSSSSISLEWTDTSMGEHGYKIERKESGGSYAVVTTTDAEATSYLDQNLSEGTTYYYRVAAVNDGNESSAYSSEAQATTSEADGGVDGGGGEPALDSIDWACLGWTGYVEGTIDDLGGSSWHVRTWILTNKAYAQGKDLTVDSGGEFYATNGLWCTPGPSVYIWVTVHDAATDIYGTGDHETMNLNQFPANASPDYVFGPFATQ